MRTIKVVELFAGVGGFRLGLEKASKKFNIVWSNQWEPSTKVQHASDIYVKRFGADNHSNENILTVKTKDIPNHDLLVGGFPCQDYSVARVLSHAKGIRGKKGVLWWEIHRILKEKEEDSPNYIFLENVDRLLKSPAAQRGRDFAIMLSTLSKLGYLVEWRVINAADYGMPQRRRRVFIMGYKKNSPVERKFSGNPEDWISKKGVLAKSFPLENKSEIKFEIFKLGSSIEKISKDFNSSAPSSPFNNSGMIVGNTVYTAKTTSGYRGRTTTLQDALVDYREVPKEFFILKNRLEDWKKLKGAKKETRITKDGFEYSYSEGSMVFPDSLDKPSRTIVTGEGGSSPSRFKHVVKTPKGLRRLMPVELEKLCMFPPGHTEGVGDTKRAFLMGNALVVGVITRIGKELSKH